MQLLNLSVETREGSGTGPSRRARMAGNVPGVVYGGGKDAIHVVFDARRFQFDIINKAGEHAIVQLDVAGAPALSGPALLKAVQHHPVTGKVVHTDFLRIELDKKVTTAVAMHFTGRAKGVVDGGVADVQLHELEIECLPLSVPKSIDVDITPLGLGDSLHVRDIVVPEGVTVISDPDRAVISIHVPRVVTESAAEEGAAEPEVVGAEGKDAEKEAEKK